MMDKLIHGHLDRRLDIQEAASEVVDKHMLMDIDALIEHPERELARVAMDVMTIVEGFSFDAVKEGRRFANEVRERDKQDRPILFQKTGDPEANA